MPDRPVNAGWFADQLAQLTGGHRSAMIPGALRGRPDHYAPTATVCQSQRVAGGGRRRCAVVVVARALGGARVGAAAFGIQTGGGRDELGWVGIASRRRGTAQR